MAGMEPKMEPKMGFKLVMVMEPIFSQDPKSIGQADDFIGWSIPVITTTVLGSIGGLVIVLILISYSFILLKRDTQ